MSVLVTLRVSADPKVVEATDSELLRDLRDWAGAGHPDISFWHHLDVNDDIG